MSSVCRVSWCTVLVTSTDVWYYGSYSLAELNGNDQYPCGNWCVQGPFVGFRHSIDNGASWVEPRMEMAKDFETYKAADNLFSEMGAKSRFQNLSVTDSETSVLAGPVCEDGQISGAPQYSCNGTWRGKVKFGAPHVVRSVCL